MHSTYGIQTWWTIFLGFFFFLKWPKSFLMSFQDSADWSKWSAVRQPGWIIVLVLWWRTFTALVVKGRCCTWKHRLYRDALLQPSRHQSATLFQKRWVSYSHGGWLDEAHIKKKKKEQYFTAERRLWWRREGGGEVKTADESSPLAHKKHHPTLTGEERRPFFLVLPWLLQIMMWWVRMTLPAAIQTSLVW